MDYFQLFTGEPECRPASFVGVLTQLASDGKPIKGIGGNVEGPFCLPLIPYFSKPVTQCGWASLMNFPRYTKSDR